MENQTYRIYNALGLVQKTVTQIGKSLLIDIANQWNVALMSEVPRTRNYRI